MSEQKDNMTPEMLAEVQDYLLSRCRIARINGQSVRGGMYYRLTARSLIRRFAPAILILLGVAWGFCFREMVTIIIHWW